ncbi:MAG: Lrp/AsnC family transcriptional regulator [Tissierellia bacterium]|nr:Lrp/AsnC family transcriptional regulator [Tissierellia bacterium]
MNNLEERTTITLNELHKRLGVSKNHIYKLEAEGLIKRLPFGKCMYSLAEIQQLERSNIQDTSKIFKTVSDLKEENKELKKEVEKYKKVLKSLVAEI